VSERLWCVHIEVLDDFIAVSSQEAAEQEAAAINAYIDRFENGRCAAAARAVAVEWPFAPASHARSRPEDWDDLQRMPHRRPGANRREKVLTNMTRRLKRLIQTARRK
jgi:hypothetical protein